jgi:hypothetical protein
MRLLQRVLPGLRQTTKPHQKFGAHLWRLLLMFPGHATLRNLSRYRSDHERTCARWYARDFEFVSLNQAAITRVSPPDQEQALVIDASCVPKSGKTTDGLDRFWNGSHSRSAKGLDISALAGRDITAHGAYCLSVAQTPPPDKPRDSEATRIEAYLEQWARVVSARQLGPLRDGITDGDSSKQQCTGGIRALGLPQSGPWRIDATRRSLSQGPKRLGPGRPNTSEGKVHGDDLSRFATVETDDADSVLYHQGLNHVPCQGNLRVVLGGDTKPTRRAVLLSTDVDGDALALSRDDTARFHIAFLCSDAKQCTGLGDSHARSQAKLTFHFNASLSAVTRAKLEGREPNGEAASGFSMASLKRRAFNHHLIARIAQH